MRRIRVLGAALAAIAIGLVVPRDADAQERDSIPGVSLGLVYETNYTPALAIRPLIGRFGGEGYRYPLVLQLHDVVYARLKETGRFRLPNPSSPDFRMAVHRASDEIVRWAFGEPGMAASRIAFSMMSPGTTNKE